MLSAQSCQPGPWRDSSLEIPCSRLGLGRDIVPCPQNIVVPGPGQCSTLPGFSSVSLGVKGVWPGLQASSQEGPADSRAMKTLRKISYFSLPPYKNKMCLSVGGRLPVVHQPCGFEQCVCLCLSLLICKTRTKTIAPIP